MSYHTTGSMGNNSFSPGVYGYHNPGLTYPDGENIPEALPDAYQLGYIDDHVNAACENCYFNQNNFEKFGLNKITTVDWGVVPEFDIVINATSIGLKKDDQLGLDFSKVGREKFFYDVIYNPKETNFLHTGKNLGNKTENGKKMFLHQAAEAFKIWHNIQPEINEEVSKLLD